MSTEIEHLPNRILVVIAMLTLVVTLPPDAVALVGRIVCNAVIVITCWSAVCLLVALMARKTAVRIAQSGSMSIHGDLQVELRRDQTHHDRAARSGFDSAHADLADAGPRRFPA